MTWEISSVVTVLGTSFAFLYLALNLPEENRSVKFYLFREWIRMSILIMAFLLLLTNFFVAFEIANPQNSVIGTLLQKWYIYMVAIVWLLIIYFFIRVLIETIKAPVVAFQEFGKLNKEPKKFERYKGLKYK